MIRPSLPFLALENYDDALELPAYASDQAAGMDLRACLPFEDRSSGIVIPPLGRALIPTGLACALPEGHEAQVRPRSGLAARNGITVLNSPGTVDADYRGELKVLLINLGAENFAVEHGMRIAQMVVAACVQAEVRFVDHLTETGRGSGGFGSTGTE